MPADHRRRPHRPAPHHAPGLGDQPRPVWQVTTAPQGFEGEGFPVRRAFAGIDLSLLDPFIIWTRWARWSTPRASPRARPWHPHRGFETVTYIIDGVIRPPGQPRRRRHRSPTATPSG